MEILANQNYNKEPKIIVIGIGGGGNNAIGRMIEAGYSRVDFAAINTDKQILGSSKANYTIQIGEKLTKGYGAGANPSVGESAAVESEDEIKELVENYDMVILTCGMGGGTGTGATPIVAQICKKLGILTIGVVTIPFTFEGGPRIKAAKLGVEALEKHVDTLLVIPNDKLLKISTKPLMLNDAFSLADNVLRYTISSITNIIYNSGTINLDFNDLRTTLENKGIGHLGIGIADSSSQIIDAFKQALESPLLDTNIEGSSNILINTSGPINLLDLNDATSYVQALAGEDVNVIWGTVNDAANGNDKIVVTIIATGMDQNRSENAIPSKKLNVQYTNPLATSQQNVTSNQLNPDMHTAHSGLAMEAPSYDQPLFREPVIKTAASNAYNNQRVNRNVNGNATGTSNQNVNPNGFVPSNSTKEIKIPDFILNKNR